MKLMVTANTRFFDMNRCSDVCTTKHGFMADFNEIFAKLIVTSSSMILSH